MSARMMRLGLAGALMSLLAACASAGPGGGMVRPVVHDPAPFVSGTLRPYQIRGRWYRPAEQPGYDETGVASWYGDAFNGKPTATGERFDMQALTAAHKTLPLPCLVEVTNVATGRRLIVRVNDRGPFVDDRILDLSRGSAEALGLLNAGLGQVRVRYLGPAPRLGGNGVQYARASRSPAPPPATAEPSSVYWIQAGAFSDRRAAGHVAARLGERASVSETGSGQLLRVVIGPWANANAAETARQAVIARGYPDALLISAR